MHDFNVARDIKKRSLYMNKTFGIRLAFILVSLLPYYPHAQTPATFPNRFIKIIVPVTPGGNNDIVARSIGKELALGLGQSVIIENRPSASSLLGTQIVAKSPPDGYTLLHVANAFVTAPILIANGGYDPVKDFNGVSLTCLVPKVLTVNPSLPAQSVKELIALAKSQPNTLTYASSGIGGTSHMATELFSHQAGIKMIHISYKGSSQAIVDVVGGQVGLMFDEINTSTPYIRSGKLRALAVTSRKRSALFPQIPTIDQAGLPGFEDITFTGLFAPTGTPKEVLTKIQLEVSRIVTIKELHERFISNGVELTASLNPEELSEFIKAEYIKKNQLIRQLGIQVE